MRTGVPELHYETIDTRARPARVAVLTDSSDADWRHTVVRIIEFLSSVWGGKHSVIVPTDGSMIQPIFWTILEKFSPDYIYFYRKTVNDIRIFRPDEYAVRLQDAIRRYEPETAASDYERERIDQALRKAYCDAFTLNSNLCSQLANRLVPFHYQEHFASLSSNGHVPHELTGIANVLPCVDHGRAFTSFQLPAEVDLAWWAAHTGIHCATLSQQLGSVGLIEEERPVSYDELGDFAHWIVRGEAEAMRQAVNEAFGGGPGFTPPDETRPTAFDLSMSRTGLYGSALSEHAVADRFCLVIGDSLADFCLAYGLRRIGYGATWLPLLWINQLQISGENPLKTCVISTVHAHNEVIDRVGLKVCSLSEKAGAVSGVLEILRMYTGLGLNDEIVKAVEATDVVAEATEAPIPYCLESPNHPEIYPFLGDKSAGSIRTPSPSGFSKLNALNHRWVAEVRAGGRTIPSIPHVAENLVSLRQTLGTMSIRVSQQGLAYNCPGIGLLIGEEISPNLENPQIQLFDTFAALSFIGKANGFECQLSDKGIYQRDSLEKLGGVSEASKLIRDDGSRAVFAKFRDHKERTRELTTKGAYCMETNAVTLLDNLTAAKVVYRGFVLGCGVCKHAEWYSLGDLADEFRCTRCGRVQTLRHQHWRHPAAPQIFYKLDEIVYQFLKSDGDVVALSLDYLSRHSNDSFNYSPEIQFRTKDSTLTGEIDFCAVWRGMLSIGEAKKQGELGSSEADTRRIIEKYVRVASLVNARKIFFCTTSPRWKSSVVRAVEQALEGKIAEPVFLAAGELLSSA